MKVVGALIILDRGACLRALLTGDAQQTAMLGSSLAAGYWWRIDVAALLAMFTRLMMASR